MASIIVNGRSYGVPESYTYREMGLIKRLSGLRSGEITDALRAGDTDLIVALAIIAMRREGSDVSEDEMLDMDVSAIDFDPGEAETPKDAAAGGRGKKKH